MAQTNKSVNRVLNERHKFRTADGGTVFGTKLNAAINRQDGKEVKELLKKGADPNLYQREDLKNISRTDGSKIFKMLNNTPLNTAISTGKYGGILHSSEYSNKQTSKTPIHEIVKDLLKAGADPNHAPLVNFEGGTEKKHLNPAEMAAIMNDHRSLAHLIQHGAEIGKVNPSVGTVVLRNSNPTLLRAKDEILASEHNLKRATKKIQNKFLDSRVDPNTRYGQLHIAEGYKAGHAAAAPAYSKVFDNSLRTMDQLIAASERKKAFEKQSPRKITKAHESPFGNRKKYSRKNKKK